MSEKDKNILFSDRHLHPDNFRTLLAHFTRLYSHPDRHDRDIESNIERIAADFVVDPGEYRKVLSGSEPSDEFLAAFKRYKTYTGVMYSLRP